MSDCKTSIITLTINKIVRSWTGFWEANFENAFTLFVMETENLPIRESTCRNMLP